MRLRVRFLSFTVAATAGLALLGTACGDNTGPGGETVVSVSDNSFSPASATVAPGGTVRWNWLGSAQHNVTWVNPAGTSNSPTQSSGTFTRNFSNAGTFDYFCTIHGTATSGMRGSVVVQ